MKSIKGKYNGECNRTACDNKEAVYFNHSTKKYYCQDCAQTINMYNQKDAMEMFGHDLCLDVTKEEYELQLLEESFSETYLDEALQFSNIDPRFSDILPSVKLKRGVYASIRTEPKLSRNSLCSCGSGKKYKKCCLNK